MIEVDAGAAAAAADHRRADRVLALLLGIANEIILLNGGSETRRDQREFWRAWAADLDVEFARLGGWGVRLGPASPRPPGIEHLQVLMGAARYLSDKT